jgi:hypothetical protein
MTRSLTQFISEKKYSETLVVIDIQPSYSHCFSFQHKFQEYLEENEFKNIIWFYNGPELGMEDEGQMKEWLLCDLEYPEHIVEDIQFEEKSYAFFRAIMDNGGFDDDELVEVVKYMIKTDKNDIRELDDEDWTELEDDIAIDDWKEFTESGDSIGLPYFHGAPVENQLRRDKLIVCGGGRDECLAEMLIYFDAINAKYKELNQFIY